MIIYTITINIENELEEEWLNWMQEIHIPHVLGTDCFINSKISNKLAKTGKRVVIAGLDKDYTANSFGPIRQLMIDAEYVSKVNAICMICGDPASFTQRISSEKDLVVVGETDKYEARCRNCYNKDN